MPVTNHKGPKPELGKHRSHKPAKHIEETARLDSSAEPDKNPEKVRKAGRGRHTAARGGATVTPTSPKFGN